MKYRLWIIIVTALIGAPVLADDVSESQAKLHEYFERFSARDIDGILGEIYANPVHIGSGSAHRAYQTNADAKKSLDSLYEQITGQGWVRSVIRRIDSCQLVDGLVFSDVRYVREKGDGEAIAPGLRSNIYVTRKTDKGWRIIAFYGKDPDVKFECN